MGIEVRITAQTGQNAWRFGSGRAISLTAPSCLGIINTTSDSFFAPSRTDSVDVALQRARAMAAEGAAGLDIGGESTRPGASRIGADEQITRAIPVIRAIRTAGLTLPISIDTTHTAVARAALEAGADIINDVSAGMESPDLFALAAERRSGLIIMHRLCAPDADSFSNQYAYRPEYPGGVVDFVCAFLEARAAAAQRAGVAHSAIVIDPGLGFGKTVEQNHELIDHLPRLLQLGYPVLGAVSRKSFVGITRSAHQSLPMDERLSPSITLAQRMMKAGVRLFRVHDVAAHVESLTRSHAARPRFGME